MKMLALLGLVLPGAALAQTVGSADKWEGTPQVPLKSGAAAPSRAPSPNTAAQPPRTAPAATTPARSAPAAQPRPAAATAAQPARTTPTPSPTPAPGISWQSRPITPPAAQTRPATPATQARTAPPAPRTAPAAAPVSQARSTPVPPAATRSAPAPSTAPGVSWQPRAQVAPPPLAAPRAQVRPAPLPTRPAEVRRAAPPRGTPILPAPPADEALVAPEQAQADPRAIRPGDRVAGAWSHPFYQLDPARHGLAPAPAGARWIRYFEGALLVDPSGRVLAARGELPDPVAPDWAEDGVPAYSGDGDYQPTSADYAQPMPGYGMPAGPPAMMVIETTTTTTRPQR